MIAHSVLAKYNTILYTIVFTSMDKLLIQKAKRLNNLEHENSSTVNTCTCISAASIVGGTFLESENDIPSVKNRRK